MARQISQPLVSIIVPAFDDCTRISVCLDSLLEQTYSNIEIIVVNCVGSNISSVIKYQENHNNITLINVEDYQGFFRARLEGFGAAVGDYLLSVNINDSISIDYVRTLVAIADKNNSDIVIPEIVTENDDERFVYNYANDFSFEYLSGAKCLDKLFEQQGENVNLYQVASPMFSRKVIDLALISLNTITEQITWCENILFSVALWNFAERVDRAQTAYYYQYETVDRMYLEVDSLKENIQDVNIVFGVVKNLLKSWGMYSVYKKDLIEWMNLYSQEYRQYINKLSNSDEQKKELTQFIKFGNEEWNKKTPSRFYSVKTKFNNNLEKLKRKIISDEVDIISFDIFDTLVMRPFLIPSDIFYLLDNEFKILDNQFRLQNFHDIRIESEKIARAENSDNEEVNLKQIYEVIQRVFIVDKNVTSEMLEKEIDLEIKYCSQRRTAKELYDLALYTEKKVIISSDMYLPKKKLEKILENCGFNNYDKLYVSSHHGVMKFTQNLYRHIAADLDVSPSLFLHIGDNYESDVKAAKEAGWKAMYFPKAIEVVTYAFEKIFSDDELYAHNHLGITTAYAIAVNKYFDNPFRSFINGSVYNNSPYFMGYFALGLSMLGFTKWMADDAKLKNITSLVFLGRDGYLPKYIFDIFNKKFKLSIKSHYLPTSRKAIIPLSIFSELNILDVKTFNYHRQFTDSILASMKPFLKDGTVSDFNNIVNNIDYKKLNDLRKAFIDTYKDYFDGNVAIMDIGYSGRPEQIFAKIFNMPIETYFLYTSSDEAKRRLGETVNVYNRLKVAAVREKLISEISSSCIGYQVIDRKTIPILDNTLDMSYYEKYFIVSVQNGAKDFVCNYLDLFSDYLDYMDMGDNRLTVQPLDQATVFPAGLDVEMYRGVMHEDSIAGDNNISIFDQYYGNLEEVNKDQILIENNHSLNKVEEYMSIKRSAKLLAGNIKRRVLYGKKR